MNQENHQHLPFPFPGRTALFIRGKSGDEVLVAELATSVIEVFQSACYRDGIDPSQPLVMQFDNPAVQSFCLQNFTVPVEQILVEHGTEKVTTVNLLQPRQHPGSHIQGFSGLSCVILAAPGFAESNHIETNHTFITLKTINYAKQS